MNPTLIAQLRQIQRKLNERTIGSSRPTDAVNNQPVWEQLKGSR